MKNIKVGVVTLIFILFSINLFANSPWDNLAHQLNNFFSYGNIESYLIQNTSDGVISFQISSTQPTLFPNNELIIKKGGSNPLATETLGFAKFLGFFNQAGSAKSISIINNISPGDILIKPYTRKVVLYTNVKDKYSFKPYADLQQCLTFNNFIIFEVNKPEEVNLLNPSEYNILVRLEVSNGLLIGKIQSLYDSTILFNQSYQFPFQVATSYPVDTPIAITSKDTKSKFFGMNQNTPNKRESYTKSKKDLGDYSFKTGKDINESKLSLSGDFEVIKYKLDREITRITTSDVDGDGHPEIVGLNNYGVFAYTIENDTIKLKYSYSLPGNSYIGISIYNGDFNKNGKDELFVTLAEKYKDLEINHTKLSSIIIEHQGGNNFKVLNSNFPYYLRVVDDRNGNKVLLCQEKEEFEPYSGKVFQVKWSGSNFKVGQPFDEAKNVYSIYGFAPKPSNKDYTLILDAFGNVSGYFAPKEEKVDIMDENLGVFTTIPYPIKLKYPSSRGGFVSENTKDFFAYRRFDFKKDYNDQVFTVKTSYNKDTTRKVISKIFKGNEEPDRIVAIKWIGNNIIKTWESDKIYGTIFDFSFFKENDKDILAVLVEDRNEGYTVHLMR